MVPDLGALVPFALVVLVAVYFHTVTGFGVAMVIMGLASSAGIVSVATLASVVSIVTLMNGVALRGNLHHVPWKIVGVMAVAVLPASVVGVLLLDYLSSEAADVIQVLLGLIIVHGGVSLAWRPTPLSTVSGQGSFAYYGFLGGLIGGMFGIPGPPLIYHLYRQPMSLAQIRSALIFLNAFIAGARTLFVMVQGQLHTPEIVLSALCLPLVVVATLAGKRFPPPCSAATMRRIAFVLLVVMGLTLIAPVLMKWLG
ncbi:sulfite exporter TauE/SafE family protein [Allopusillimonas ginsengisoli]|uniref:sulfite exporter TauE/SafE family protein n=1 Tax=Allopusillimonas ginsengisoli TaxID=453575 RepID=UPI00101F6019|nr:sulfite exporter TauE/SafE family protein [Allopusillimonas ginsengisoli]TEA78877.1 sulfite exporter TauE/SafE family protein [Allopusillimonas ginsengisoli]